MPCSRTQHGLTRVGLEPPTSRPLYPESEALTTRSPRSPWEGVIFCWDIRGNYATKSTSAECVKRLCLGCVDELLAAFLEFLGVEGEAG